MFAFLFGLSMDYEVFILSRMREEYDRTGETERGGGRGIGRTGRLVTSAALILFLAFAALGSGPDTAVKILATGLAAGILHRRDDHPGAARARGGLALRALELGAAAGRRARAAGRAVAPAGAGGGGLVPLPRTGPPADQLVF